MRFITFFLGLVALLVATNSAYFSITGLSQLFAGSTWAIIAMAGSLEAAKLVIAAFLYKQWTQIKWLLKTYMTIALVVLIIISSIGIYGFLTAAYQSTADRLQVMDGRIELVETRKDRFESRLTDYRQEQERLTSTINELNRGISEGTTFQYVDEETGQLVTTISTAARSSIEEQLNDAREQRDMVRDRMEEVNDSILTYETEIINIRESSDIAAEVGPLRYLAEITDRPMNQVVNWLSLLIMIVFDPLGVSLVIGFTMSATIDRNRRIKQKMERGDYEVYGDKEVKEPIVDENKTNANKNEEKIIKPKKKEDKLKADKKQEHQIKEKLYEKFKQEEKKKSTKSKPNKYPIDIDGDGIVDGYDITGDGLIDEFTPSTSMRYNYVKDRRPYYARKNFDWSDKAKWINDVNAVNYYNTYIAPRTEYPKNFHTKTY